MSDSYLDSGFEAGEAADIVGFSPGRPGKPIGSIKAGRLPSGSDSYPSGSGAPLSFRNYTHPDQVEDGTYELLWSSVGYGVLVMAGSTLRQYRIPSTTYTELASAIRKRGNGDKFGAKSLRVALTKTGPHKRIRVRRARRIPKKSEKNEKK
ncbi:hypothetical protein ACFLQN_01250 [Candidatus Aenigmatarchaeota archaeon]